MKLSSRFFLLGAATYLLCVLASASAQSWPAPSFQIGTVPSRPLAFVARFSDCDHFGPYGNRVCQRPNFGTDARNADLPEHVADLWVLLPNGTTRKLFPLNIARDINLTGSAIGSGAVVEPNASLDGQDIIFSYFPDVFDSQNAASIPLGADIYRIKLAPLIQNNSFPVEQLEVQRLTFQPSMADRFKDALNPGLAQATQVRWIGVVNMHPIEFLSDHAASEVAGYGPRKLAFVSDRRRLQQSNGPYHYRHHNFNLFTGDLKADGSLFNVNQFQYYTTTSVMSPFNLRNGFGFSYVGTTKSDRHWEVQQVNSAGTWAPLQGYARDASNSFHLSTLCATQANDTNGQADYSVTTSYYNSNNNGFGAIIAAPMNAAGVNDNFGNSGTPAQLGEINLSAGVSDIQDQPSFYDSVTGRFRGKFSTPRCAGVNKLYLAYSPNAAAGNGSIWQGWCQSNGFALNACPYIPGLYDSKIVLRESISSFDPLGGGYSEVIDDISNSANGYSYWSLVWPTLLNPIEEKFGNVKPAASTTWALKSGMPWAKVGTSALWNTDVTAPECRFGQSFKPANVFNTNGGNHVLNNVGLLSIIRDLSGNFANPAINPACLNPVTKDMVYGIALQITDNKTDVSRNTESVMSRNETRRLLGVYRTVGQTFNNQEDQSFQAIVPANVPFQFQLLEKRTGLRLADVPTWHSLKAGETRNNCGGCHGHGHHLAPVDIATTLAGQASYQPADFVNQTPSITYDATCQPQETVLNSASEAVQLWDNGTPLFQGFVTNCAGCHAANTATGNSTFIVTPSDAEASYISLRPYLNRDPNRKMDIGAIGTSAFWAAYGQRLDGRPDCDPSFSAVDAKYWCFNPNHHRNITNQPMFCDGSNPTAAAWLYNFGRWLDNHAPRGCDFAGCYDNAGQRIIPRIDIAPGYGDRFHPSVSGALADSQGCSLAQGLNVGFWDDSGQISRLELQFESLAPIVVTQAASGGPLLNGSYLFGSGQLAALQNSIDVVKVVAVDAAGNQQGYEFTLDHLIYQCQVAVSTLGDPQGSGPGGGNSGSGEPPGGGGSFGGGNSLVSFSQSSNVVGPGQIVRLSVRASERFASEEGAKFVVLGSARGSSPGTEVGGTHVDLNEDAYFAQTSKRLSGAMMARAGGAWGVIDLQVPSTCKKTKGIRLNHVGGVLGADGVMSGVSGSKTLKIVSRKKSRALSPLEKEIKAASKKLIKVKRKGNVGAVKSATKSVKVLKNKLAKSKILGKSLFGALCGR